MIGFKLTKNNINKRFVKIIKYHKLSIKEKNLPLVFADKMNYIVSTKEYYYVFSTGLKSEDCYIECHKTKCLYGETNIENKEYFQDNTSIKHGLKVEVCQKNQPIVFKNRTSLKQHIRQEINNTKFVCLDCYFYWKNKILL